MSLLLAAGSSGSSYTLTGLAGSYSLSGGAATLKVGRNLTANAGSYSLSGGSATLTKSTGAIAYSLTALAGSYSLSGGSAALKVGRNLTALAGSYALSGGSAVMTKTGVTAYTLTALSGSYSITGGNAVLSWSGQTAGIPSNEVQLRKTVVKHGDKYLMFNSAQEAEAWAKAEEIAEKAIEKAKGRKDRQKIRKRVYQYTAKPQVIDTGALAYFVDTYQLGFDLPQILEKQDTAELVRIALMVQEIQDEEEIELLLLA